MAESYSVASDEKLAYANDPRWLLVERILATRDFERAPRLSEFLRHICELTLQGREELISEQYIGAALFGRPPDYDSTSDTIVRSHALRLRRRLEHYFQREGRFEALQLVIPRGGYVPLFLPVSESSTSELQENAGTEPVLQPSDQFVGRHINQNQPPHAEQPGPFEHSAQPERHDADAQRHGLSKSPSAASDTSLFAVLHRFRTILTLTLCLVIALVTLVIYQWYTLRTLRAHEYHERNHPLWSRLFNAQEPTQIVLGDSGLVLFHAVARRYVSLHDYANGDLTKELPYVERTDPDFALFLAGRRYTSLTDATTAIRLLRLPEARPDRTTVSFTRDMHIDDFKNGNIVMIGAQEADPWVELFEPQMDFAFSIDNPDKHSVFLNRRPQPGEPSVYNPEREGPHQVYAVIAFLPNLTASGNVLLLEGISMAGTESAADLVTDDQRLLPILRGIQRPDGTLPHFEMMIATSVVKDSPAPPQVVALHVHR